MVQTTVYLRHSDTSPWTPPAGITTLDSVECIGDGQNGGTDNTGFGGTGGNAGSWAIKSNVPVSGTVAFQVGGGNSLTSSWFKTTATVLARSGGSSTTNVGDATNVGGFGAGGDGFGVGGGGGGAAGASAAGGNASGATGGQGDGSLGGAGGSVGTDGSGGTEYDPTHGSGGGGGGNTGGGAGNGGLYGAGGGGGDGSGNAGGLGSAGLIIIKYTSSHAYTQSCLAATNGLATAAKGSSHASPASSSPTSAVVRSVAAIRRGSSAPLTSTSHAIAATRRGVSSPLALLTRSAAAVRRATSSPIASNVHTGGKALQASSTPTKSLRNAMAAARQATTTPAKSLVRSIAHALPRATFPVASLALANAAIRQATTAPVASDTKSAGKLFQGSSAPVASSGELKTALQSALTTTSPVGRLIRSAGKAVQALAVGIASNVRIRPVGLQSSSAPLATSSHPVGKFLQAITHPVAFNIPGKPLVLQASTSPLTSTLHAMARAIGILTPLVGSPYRVGAAASSVGSGLTIQTTADMPSGSLVIVVAAQYGGQFSSVSDPAGSGYLGTDANATTTPIYSTVFYAIAAADILAGAFVNLFSAVSGQARSAAIMCVPISGGTVLDSSGNFNAANGTTPSAATGPLAFAGEIVVGYTVSPGGVYGQAPGFAGISNNNTALGLHVAAQASGDLNPIIFAPVFGTPQDYGINVISFRTGWSPTASVARSLAHTFSTLAAAVASLMNQGGKVLQAASSPVASMVGNLVASGVENVSASVVATLQSAVSIARNIGVTVIASRLSATGKVAQSSSQGVASLTVLKAVIALIQVATSPLTSNVHAAQKAIIKAVSVVVSRLDAMTKTITITTTQIASGRRSFVSTFLASSSVVATLSASIVHALSLAAASSPLAAMIRSAAKVLRGQTAPVASDARATAGGHPTITTPIASLTRSTAKPVGGASNVIASTSHAIGHHIQAVAASIVATVKRTVPALPFRASTSPIASLLASPLRVKIIQASATAVASLATVWRFFGRRAAAFMRGRKV